MDVRQVADGLFPCWCMGLWMMYLIYNSDHKDLLRVSKEGLLRFARFLAIITLARIFYITVIAPDAVVESMRHIGDSVPWQTMFGVFWEDMCNAVPLVIIGRMIEGKKWLKPLYMALIAAMSFVFGALHSYEGMQAVLTLMFYIPFTMRLGKKYGFGTVMLCHIAYDLLTFFTFQIVAGL